MKNIIIPVDFSKYSEFALKTAALLAKKHQVNLILLHMLEMPTGYSDHDSDYGKSIVFLIKYAEKKMQNFIKKEYLEGISIKVVIKHYTLFSEIGQLAASHDASLIIMGSHGVSEHNDTFLGSNTERVVRNSPIPVLVIKDELENVNFANAVYVSDFKEESINAYKKARAFFNFLKVKPTLLFINKPNGGFVSTCEMNARFKSFLLKADGNLKHFKDFANYDDYTVIAGIKYFAHENNISLIAVATHGKSSLSKFFNKSISLDLANKSTLPVLTVLI